MKRQWCRERCQGLGKGKKKVIRVLWLWYEGKRLPVVWRRNGSDEGGSAVLENEKGRYIRSRAGEVDDERGKVAICPTGLERVRPFSRQ